MKTREYAVKYKLNGITDIYYITATEANYTESEVVESVISRTKKDFRINRDDDFKIIEVQLIRKE